MTKEIRSRLDHFGCVDKLLNILNMNIGDFNDVGKVYCEFPSIILGSAREAAAAQDVLMIAYMCGGLARLCRHPKQFVPVLVREWKGMLPKRICHQRIKKILPGWILPGCGGDEHELDAIGIGLFIQGRF